MFETILAVVGGVLALLFGAGWAKSSWRSRQAEEELSEHWRASAKQQDAAIKAALKIQDDLARQKPIDTKNRGDFQ